MAYTTRTEFRIGRDARTGRFVPIRLARIRPSTTVIEVIRVNRRTGSKVTKSKVK